MREELLPLIEELTGPAPAPALSALAEQAKKKEARLAMDALLGDRERVCALLNDPAPKARKNAARLLGALGHAADAAALAHALHTEDTLFVIPSLLLALGSLGGPTAAAALAAYTPPAPRDETEDKHCREIATALGKAKGAACADAALPVYALAQPRDVLLAAPDGFAGVLYEELNGLGLPARYTDGGALVRTADLTGLFRARCFTELLLPLGRDVPFTPRAIADIASAELTLPYRVELRAGERETFPRRAFLTGLVSTLGGQNNPARYALELRVEKRGELCDLFLKPSLPDPRFAYRKAALPASISPALAACLVLSFCKKRKNQRKMANGQDEACAHEIPVTALDPCCGSGTLLIELEKRLALQGVPCRALIGVDIAENALTIARENAAAAGSTARFVHKDILGFAPREPFDLIVSNLPFGNRVGSHANNERLYRGLVARLPSLLKPGGLALLYTMEYRLLRDCLKGVQGLTLLSRRRTEAGGLLPWVFLLQNTPAQP